MEWFLSAALLPLSFQLYYVLNDEERKSWIRFTGFGQNWDGRDSSSVWLNPTQIHQWGNTETLARLHFDLHDKSVELNHFGRRTGKHFYCLDMLWHMFSATVSSHRTQVLQWFYSTSMPFVPYHSCLTFSRAVNSDNPHHEIWVSVKEIQSLAHSQQIRISLEYF